MCLPDSSQPITIVIIGVMMAIRWLKARIKKNNQGSIKDQLEKYYCLNNLDFFETCAKL